MYTAQELLDLHQRGMRYDDIGKLTKQTSEAVRSQIRRARQKAGIPAPRLPASPYPQYDQPLRAEGDALIINDLEVPFHHADFVNRCLDLAQAWKIETLMLGGDIMHFETFSAWGAAWQQEKPAIDQISEEREKQLRAIANGLTGEAQGALLEQIEQMAANREATDDEIKSGSKALKVLAQVFENIYYVLGNHDDRFLRRLNSPMTPQKLLNFLGLTESCWHIAPYFRGIVDSGGQVFYVEHQRSAAPNAAVRIADTNDAHTIVAHNHMQSFQYSTNGRYYAISSGHGVDEKRLPYAAQRKSNRPAHALGAVIIRGGYPFLLHPCAPWEMLARI